MGIRAWWHKRKIKVKTGSTRAVEPLIKALGHKSRIERWKAADALGMIGDCRAVEPLILALEDNNDSVQLSAIDALGMIGDCKAVEPLIKKLEWGYNLNKVRCSASEALGMIGDCRAVEPLIIATEDGNDSVQWNVTGALEKICSQILSITFGEIQTEVDKTLLHNPDVSKLAVPIEKLTEIIVDTETYDFDMVERFMTYAVNYIGEKYLKENIEVHIYGNPVKLNLDLYHILNDSCRKVEFEITVIIFGQVDADENRTTWKNPDVSEITMPMKKLHKILIDTETYDFHMVEKFITYAVNYIGKKHLKENVEVRVYSDPDKLNPNLRNLFENLCKK